MKHKILISIAALLLSVSAFCGPARKEPVYLMQPDGTGFTAKVRGDEFMKITTTLTGNAIIQDRDGWWCYAQYDDKGRPSCSGYRVENQAPAEIMAGSMKIPYGTLSARGAAKRASATSGVRRGSIMKKLLERDGVTTKNSDIQPITKHGIIILAQFKDIKFTYTKEDFVKMLTESGYSLNGATGSAKEYFESQFGGSFEFSFDVSSIVTLANNVSYYGENDDDGNDKLPERMITEACTLVDNEIDFSLYDDDGDNVVDNVFVFFAGGDEAEGAGNNRIWSHAWYIYSGAMIDLTLDGKRIDSYACTSELSNRGTRNVLAGIGTFCHEYAHTFGLPDMYDTDYEKSDGTADALWGATSLMDHGNHNNSGNTPPNFNAIEKEILGIMTPTVIEEDGGYSLVPISSGGGSYRLDTDHKDEYFLIECRAKEGWDSYIEGSGMLVYHLDKSDRSAGYSERYAIEMTARQRWENYNEVNCRPDHQCADLIEASASAMSTNEVFFPSGSVNSITPDGSPGLQYWSGEVGKISIANIRNKDNEVTFNILGFSNSELPPKVKSHTADRFMDAAIIHFESDRVYRGDAVVEWGRNGEYETVNVKPFEPGRYSLTLENLETDNKTYIIKVHFELNSFIGEEYEFSVVTKRKPTIDWPYIHLSGTERHSDGSFPVGAKLPLRVYNATDASEITWTFNGSRIKPGGDGYFTIKQGGTLKAHIIWENGSEEVLMKEIIIKEEGQQ